MGAVDSRLGCELVGVRVGSIWELLLLSIQFCCEHKTSLKKIKLIKKKKSVGPDNDIEWGGEVG